MLSTTPAATASFRVTQLVPLLPRANGPDAAPPQASDGPRTKIKSHWLQAVQLPLCFCGLASKNYFTIGTMTGIRSICVTCVVLGKTANLDAERGRMSPKISPPLRRNISAM
jgi:hypothetical protein